MASKSVKIENIDQARKYGAEYGVEFPAGRGRPPMKKLAEAIKAKGHKIIPTDYFTGEFAPPLPPAAPGEAMYELRHSVSVQGDDGKKRRKRIVKRMNVAEIRKLVNAEGLRGKVSESRVLEAFAAKLDMATDDLTGATVVRLRNQAAEERPVSGKAASKPATKAASKSAKASKAPAKGASTPKADDLVSADASGSEQDAA